MIKAKEKPCKGTGKAKGFGCGTKQLKRRYGLGINCRCFSNWLQTTDAGKEVLSKHTLRATKKAKTSIQKQNREETRKKKIDIMSPDKYRARYVQPLINKIARLIDHGHPCVPTGNFEGKMAGGHFTSVGSNRTICLNLHNIFIQSFHSNNWKGGDNIRYREALKRIFGEDYLEYIEWLNSCPPIKLSKDDLIEVKEKALTIIKVLEREGKIHTIEKRIEQRNLINLELGIYNVEYCKFERKPRG